MGGMPMAKVEDARIVVDELCISLLEIGGGNPLSLSLTVGPDGLSIRGSTRDARSPNRRRSAISNQILEVLTDHHRLTHHNGHATVSATIAIGRTGHEAQSDQPRRRDG